MSSLSVRKRRKRNERKELVDIFFDKDSDSHESLTQNYCTEMTDDEEFLTSFFIEAFGWLTDKGKALRDYLKNVVEEEE